MRPAAAVSGDRIQGLNRPVPATNPAPAAATSPEMAAALRQLGGKTNLVQQIQKQFLSDAGPEANQEFNQLVTGMLSGKLTVNDLRTQAKSISEQVRAAQKEMGGEASWALDSYLAILDHFLAETAPAANSATNALKAR